MKGEREGRPTKKIEKENIRVLRMKNKPRKAKETFESKKKKKY